MEDRRHGASLTSIMLDVKLSRDDPVPLYDQVCAEIRRAIADGEIGPGERLPPARDLAAVLNVNTNTVLRALRLLREEGLLEFRRGRGVTVTGSARRGAVLARARDLVQFARRHGYDRDELIRLIQTIS
jgi:GntR family transcriptional regulator